MDWNSIIAPVIASLLGLLITALARLVDRYLPDPENRHPLPLKGETRSGALRRDRRGSTNPAK